MRKFLPTIFIPLLVMLEACGTMAQSSTAIKLPTLAPTTSASPASTCQTISLEPTPDSKITSLFPPVSDKDYSVGPANAPMTIIEYGDFQ